MHCLSGCALRVNLHKATGKLMEHVLIAESIELAKGKFE